MAASLQISSVEDAKGWVLQANEHHGPLVPQMLALSWGLHLQLLQKGCKGGRASWSLSAQMLRDDMSGKQYFCCHHQKDQDTSCIICFLTETLSYPCPGVRYFSLWPPITPPTNIPLFYVIVSVSIFLGMGRSPMTLFLSREEYSRDSFIHLQIFIEHLLSLGTVQSTEVAEVIKTNFSSAHFQTNGRDRW